MSMAVYKILRQDEWEALKGAGRSAGSPDDVRDGYVHLSTGVQVPQTLNRHFASEGNLWLLEFEEAVLGPDIRWEASGDGDAFPHLYRQLELGEVERAEQIVPGHPLPFGL